MASRILLADDSITIQKVVNLTFADEGIEVVAVSNGDQAERRLAEVQPDLVLADIFMPGKNGYELCEAIKTSAQFCNVPVVLLVGAFEPFDQLEAQRVKADAHLTKPFESRTLVETVRKLISANPRTSAAPIVTMPAAGDSAHDQGSGARAAVPDEAPRSDIAGKFDLSTIPESDSARTSAPDFGNTGELASPSPDDQQEVFDLGVVDAPARDSVRATLTDTSERFDPLEFSPDGDFSRPEVASRLDLDARAPEAGEMSRDFDTPNFEVTTVSPEPISFETGSNDSQEVNVTDTGEGEDWFNPARFETSEPKRPSDDSTWRAPSNGSPVGYESPAFTMQTETGYHASEASTDTACATLLAVDDPLGDVLFDDSVGIGVHEDSEMPANDSLGLEFLESEGSEAGTAVSTQFDLVGLGEASTAEESTPDEPILTADEPTAGVAFPVDADTEAVEHATMEETQAPDDRLDSVPSEQDFDSHTVSGRADSNLDWTTPRAAAYSTGQLDSVVMPIGSPEYLASHSAGEPAQQPESTEQASFTTPTTWTEEEARFVPIDIEAVAVNEALTEESSAAVTGFEFSSVPEEPPIIDAEPVASVSTQEPANGAAPAALSSDAIEQIVRRVVAEMSESVVREVAWEVVPDCVERVIEQLTRESLSRRA